MAARDVAQALLAVGAVEAAAGAAFLSKGPSQVFGAGLACMVVGGVTWLVASRRRGVGADDAPA